MIDRVLEEALRKASGEMPVVAVTGPRQSGKTTLCRACFPDHDYLSLEPLDTRDFARSDPRGFLKQHGGPVILDEVQRAPDLFSYVQEEVDRDGAPGRFVLTGSQHFGLLEAISQSLAGRVAMLHLLPPSLEELTRFPGAPDELWETIWSGAYPRIHDHELDPAAWLADYAATYVQRDVRQILEVANLDAFTTVLRLVAGRTAQELNLSAIGADAGVSYNTVRSWISVLETSFLVFRARPWLRNQRKRVVKAPKLHFVDTGLACHLLGIREPSQLRTHPLRGALFESWVASEVLKARVHRRATAELYHRRESRGVEIDLIVEAAGRTIAVEAKSGATVAGDFLDPLRDFLGGPDDSTPNREGRLIYGGDRRQSRSDVEVLPWSAIQDVGWS